MITVHHLNNSRSQRVLWLLEELGVPYRIVRYQRDPATLFAPKELLAIHPLGKSPVITDGGLTIAESGAIIEYLLETYGQGRLVPAEKRRFTYWLHYAEGSAMPVLLLKLIFTRLPGGAPALVRPVARLICKAALSRLVDPQLSRHMAYWESELGKSPWFAGDDFSAADIQMSFPVEAAASRSGMMDGKPLLRDFLKRIHARPAYQRALEQGGPYDYARD
ncbi:MAG TPA: glutathione S-transferase [Magnetospirillaceae bacterium]|nr:glutathione S-transferase [Magnetospirillaceae bacterium]